jgi:hypothetical protein
MITVLASMAGFIGSVIPECIKYMQDKNDKKHELEILKLQMSINSKSHDYKLDEIIYNTDMAESKFLSNTYKTGIDWVDALNGTVRPVLAYSFFILYGVAKYFQYEIYNLTYKTIMINPDLIWGVEDQSIFASIISFYYGQRAISKLRK